MRRFTLYLRGSIYYAKFYDPKLKKFTSGLSTGERDKKTAMATVYGWEKYGRQTNQGQPAPSPEGVMTYAQIRDTLNRGIFTTGQLKNLSDRIAEIIETLEPSSPLLVDYLSQFWDYENSPYIQERLSFGHKLGKEWALAQARRVSYWKDFLGPNQVRLKEVTADTIRDFQRWIITQGIAPRTANACTDVAVVALRWAYERGQIEDVTKGLRKFAPKYKKRGIMDPAEAREIFLVPWKDNRTRVANLLASTTGMRSGEVIALRIEDIGLDRVSVRHSWNTMEGRKSTKTGEERDVPLLPSVRAELLKLAESNPFNDGLIFYGIRPGEPMLKDRLLDGLKEAYTAMVWPRIAEGIEDTDNQKEIESRAKAEALVEFKERALTFHSWRHFWVTNVASATDQKTVQQIAVHKTQAMSEHYANHATEANFKKAVTAIASVFSGSFGEVVPFPKEVAK